MAPSSARRPAHQTSLKRRVGVRDPRPKVLVVCEGETELQYFTGLRASDRHDIHPVRAEKSRKPQKERVIAHAREARHKAAYSAIWTVFDTDGTDVRDLCTSAKADGIRAAPSTPAFEVWLILHLRPTVQGRTAAEVGRELKRLEPRWNKGNGTSFTHFANGLDDACRHAQRLPDHGNPSTQVWRLIDELRQ